MTSASNSSVGLRVTIETAPAALLRPNSVPCGPFSTSMRSMSLKASSEAPVRAEYTPSTYTPTAESVPTPKSPVWMPRIWYFGCVGLPSDTTRPGTKPFRSPMFSAATSLIRSLFTTCTAMGTSCSDCVRRCAVTTTSSRMEEDFAASGTASCAQATCGARSAAYWPASAAATARARNFLLWIIMNPVVWMSFDYLETCSMNFATARRVSGSR